MGKEDLLIKTKLDEKSLKGSVKRAEKITVKSAKKIANSFTKSYSVMKNNLMSFKGLIGTIVAGYAVKTVVDAAAQQEEAINDLNTSLKNAGTFSQEASQMMQKFASDLQKVTVVGDETSIQMMALARNFTQTNEQAMKLTEAAINLSAATGISLESAVRNLGKTFGGLLGELGENVPALRGLSVEALKSGAAIDLVLKRFGKAAEAKIKTFAGAFQQLKNLFGDFLETLGVLITQSPVVIKLLSLMAKGFSNMSDSLTKIKRQKDVIGDLIIGLIDFALKINQFVVAPIMMTFRLIKAFFLSVRVGLFSIINGIVQQFGFLAEQLQKLPK